MNAALASSQSKLKNQSGPPRTVVPRAHARGRSLLALDGATMTPQVLSAAETRCLQMSGRVDILLVNSPKAPESLLHRLLISLEQTGIDYRLTSASGGLGEHLTNYLRRHAGIREIVVATLPTLGHDWDVKVADLRYQGYCFNTFAGLRDF